MLTVGRVATSNYGERLFVLLARRNIWSSTRSHLASQGRPYSALPTFRKHFKDSASQKQGPTLHTHHNIETMLARWELTVGIEIHAELNTKAKLFSLAATSVFDGPNLHTAPFDLAFPGSQPRVNMEAIIPAVRAGLAMNCQIKDRSRFDRKHYFYPDQPAGYQITQYYEPFATDGFVTLSAHDGIFPEDRKTLKIDIERIQLEQDTAKTSVSLGNEHKLDFNRVSSPLIEIVTKPTIHHPAVAAAYVRKVQGILKSVDALKAGMEFGGLRADVNVSVRERAFLDRPLGPRTEIKNLSSFKAVEHAIIDEMRRQISALEKGGEIVSETRGRDAKGEGTFRLREKGEEVDYRYIPDPDIAPLILSRRLVQHLREGLPLTTDEKVQMLSQTDGRFRLRERDAAAIVTMDNGKRLDYFLDLTRLLELQLSAAAESFEHKEIARLASNWIIHQMGQIQMYHQQHWTPCLIPVQTMCSVLVQIIRGCITSEAAKEILSKIAGGDKRILTDIIREDGLQFEGLSEDEYKVLAAKVVKTYPELAAAALGTRTKGKLMWLVGRIIKEAGKAKVNPHQAEKALLTILASPDLQDHEEGKRSN